MTLITASPDLMTEPRGNRSHWIALVSWPIVAWTANVFLTSLPYKFSNHPDTQHIFTTIGNWLGTGLGTGVGDAFSRFGAYAVGGLELLTALILLAPMVLWLAGRVIGRSIGPSRAFLHTIGGVMAAGIMAGAVFFHLASPLGVVVQHHGQSDGGSLFMAAVSILVLGGVLAALNRRQLSQR